MEEGCPEIYDQYDVNFIHAVVRDLQRRVAAEMDKYWAQCANKTCKESFIRTRSDKIYCSMKCQILQNQRERRRAAKKEASEKEEAEEEAEQL